MPAKKGKRVALGILVVGLTVLIFTAFVFRKEILYEYYIWKIGSLENLIERGIPQSTALVGGPGGGPFTDVPLDGTLLTGFQVTTSTLYGGHLTIKSLQPIFLSRKGTITGAVHGAPHGQSRRIEAKEGYAVGSFVARAGHRVNDSE